MSQRLSWLCCLGLLTACGQAASTGSNVDGDGDVVSLDDASGTADGGGDDAGLPDPVDARADANGGLDAGDPGDGSGQTPDGATALPDGEPCEADAACESGTCIALADTDGLGVCTSPCAEDADCAEGADCVLVTNSGGDATRVCIPRDLCFDADGDGFGVGPACDGPDCDESRDDINLGADEVCDAVDNDCDGVADEGVVGLGDPCETGFQGECTLGRTTCDGGSVVCTPLRSPATEVCDTLDNDCDGAIDEDALLALTWYVDADGDRYGDPASAQVACTRPEGRISEGGDCSDSNAAVNPGAVEVCDGVDNDCNGGVDEDTSVGAATWYPDGDGDGVGTAVGAVTACAAPAGFVAIAGDCDDSSTAVSPTVVESCDGVDNDCDGDTDEPGAIGFASAWADVDGDGQGDPATRYDGCEVPAGYVFTNTDCNDSLAAVFFGAVEVCNSVDDDCDGTADEPDAADAAVWYADADRDGAGDAAVSTRACGAPGGFVANASDCNDTNSTIRPGASEVCNGIDENCNGVADDGVLPTWFRDRDNDAWGDDTTTQAVCTQPAGFVARGGDCADTVARINPGAVEICDGFDNDCNSRIDNATCPANCVGRSDGSRGYMFCNSLVTWGTARSVCVAEEQQLVKITSAAQNTFVFNTARAADVFNTTQDLWIGASDETEGEWRWQDGTLFWRERGTPLGLQPGAYANWTGSEPNDDGEENCGEMKTDGRWNDVECESTQRYVCSW
jgi:hypothetical protein